MTQTNFAFPVKLDGSFEVNTANIAKFYSHVEKEHKGGYYPLGGNTIWHGGIHLRVARGTEVFATLPGKIVAARLPENEGIAIRRYGHIGFILLEHVFKSQKLYSLYCHLDNLPLSASNQKIQKIAWLASGGIQQNLDRMKTGAVVKFDIPVKAGDLLWFSGEYGSPGSGTQAGTPMYSAAPGSYGGMPVAPIVIPSSRTGLLHWEVFSEAQIFNKGPLATPPQTLRPWQVAEDTDENFNVDQKTILDLFPRSMTDDENLTTGELATFYKDDLNGNASSLRDTACRFVSEWGIPDLEQACKELKNRWPFLPSPQDNIEPFQWWKQAATAGVALPASPHVWHYHPVRILEEALWISQNTPYGNFALALNDNDSTKLWGGEIRTVKGDFVAELQRDLVALGYWISDGATTNGMVTDGKFSKRTKGAVCTFQRELALPETGIVDRGTASKIKECRAKTGWNRPSHVAGTYGDFLQLKPSNHIRRYLEDIDGNGVVTDNWGRSEVIDLLNTLADDWAAKGNGAIQIGDISAYEGGAKSGHNSHKKGTQVDICYGNATNITSSSFDREKSLEYANAVIAAGAHWILFNCKYVVDSISTASAMIKHHHHFHVEATSQTYLRDAANECALCHADVYKACTYSGKIKREESTEEATETAGTK